MPALAMVEHDCRVEGCAADRAELAALLGACRSLRARQELQQWIDHHDERHPGGSFGVGDPAVTVDSLEADAAEMAALLKGCRRQRVRQCLQPWFDSASQKMRTLRNHSSEDLGAQSSNAAPLLKEQDLPIVVIAGARKTCTRRLLRVLSGRSAAEGGEEVAADGILETKYYTARVRYQVVDLDVELAATPDGAANSNLPDNAAAVILLWDTSRPETFACLRREVNARKSGAAEDEGRAAQPKGVQLCVAAEGPAGGDAAALQGTGLEAQVLEWCAEQGFEHLCCPCGDGDLEVLSQRLQGAGELRGGAGLLSADTDGTALRILEALECHAWPGMEMRRERGAAGAAAAGAAPEAGAAAAPGRAAPGAAAAGDGRLTMLPLKPDASLVVIAGAPSTGKRRLVRALADGLTLGGEERLAYGRLDTKYYSARVCYQIVDLEPEDARGESGGSSLPHDAEATILLWDLARPETLGCARRAVAALREQRPYDREGGEAEEEEEGVRLCVAVKGLGDGGAASRQEEALEEEALSWCAEHGFEHLCCAFDDSDLAAVRARLQVAREGSSAGLLERDTDGTALRILEALECHSWPGLTMKSQQGQGLQRGGAATAAAAAPAAELGAAAATRERAQGPGAGEAEAEAEAAAPAAPAMPGPAAAPAGRAQKKGVDADANAGEAIERLSDEIRAVRAMENDAERRQRACEVAMRLAEALGVDSDSEDGN